MFVYLVPNRILQLRVYTFAQNDVSTETTRTAHEGTHWIQATALCFKTVIIIALKGWHAFQLPQFTNTYQVHLPRSSQEKVKRLLTDFQGTKNLLEQSGNLQTLNCVKVVEVGGGPVRPWKVAEWGQWHSCDTILVRASEGIVADMVYYVTYRNTVGNAEKKNEEKKVCKCLVCQVGISSDLWEKQGRKLAGPTEPLKEGNSPQQNHWCEHSDETRSRDFTIAHPSPGSQR